MWFRWRWQVTSEWYLMRCKKLGDVGRCLRSKIQLVKVKRQKKKLWQPDSNRRSSSVQLAPPTHEFDELIPCMNRAGPSPAACAISFNSTSRLPEVSHDFTVVNGFGPPRLGVTAVSARQHLISCSCGSEFMHFIQAKASASAIHAVRSR